MATAKKKSTVQTNNPGTLVLQWLTYAFWGWTVLALTWLTAISVGYYVKSGTSTSGESTVIAYSLAAVIVLFIISLVCDTFYSRVEPLRKHGAATVIMIIHAVIFALSGIASLIAAVFAVVRLLIGDGTNASNGDSGAMTTLITGAVIAAVFGATLLRVLRPFKFSRSSLVYWLFMGLVTVTITGLAIAGPAWNARETRDDRLIERGLPLLSEAIRVHTEKADALPTTLADIQDKTTGDARTLIERGLVEYEPGKEVEQTATDLPLSVDPKSIVQSAEPVFAYTLCVTYKAKSGYGGTYYYPPSPDGVSVSPDTYQHDVGRVCYDLQTGYTDNGKYY